MRRESSSSSPPKAASRMSSSQVSCADAGAAKAAAQIAALCAEADEPGILRVDFSPGGDGPPIAWSRLEPWTRSRSVTVAVIAGALAPPAVEVVPASLTAAAPAAAAPAESAPVEWTMEVAMGEGEGLYNAHCGACHQPNGQGLAAAGFPAIAGSAVGDILLYGRGAGMMPTARRKPEAMANALGWASTWRPISEPRSVESSVVTRVTMTPAVMEMSSPGICDTRPSPMVNRLRQTRRS